MSYDESIYDGDDDDVFKKSDSSSEFTSGASYSVNNNRNVPGYLRDALERYIRENPQIKDSFQNFRDPSSLSHFVTIFALYSESLYHFAPARPANHWTHLRAVIQVLDNQHEGLIQRLSEAYDIEYKLQRLHSNYIAVLNLHEAIVDCKSEPTQISDMMIQYLSSLAEICKFSISSLIEKYAYACDVAGIPIDEQLVEFGIKLEGDFSYASTSCQTQLSVHYKYGDVSSIGASHEESFRSTFTKFLLPIIFSDEKQASDLLHDYAQSNS